MDDKAGKILTSCFLGLEGYVKPEGTFLRWVIRAIEQFAD